MTWSRRRLGESGRVLSMTAAPRALRQVESRARGRTLIGAAHARDAEVVPAGFNNVLRRERPGTAPAGDGSDVVGHGEERRESEDCGREEDLKCELFE